MGCNFCTTSAFFGGKGKFVNFFERGEDLFRVMCEAERRLGARSFFMMDENFLLYKKRALELLDLMKAHGKAWSLYVFSSANAIRKYDIRQLVELGVEWIWLGLESPAAGYQKLKGTDTLALARELQSHGIRVHGSTIIGLEHHTPDNIDAEIEHAVAHDTVFHQFMLYTPVPGTPLYREVAGGGPAARRRRPRRHPRAVQVQLPARRDLARRVEDVARSRVPPRLRAQRAEPVPADAEHDGGLAPLSRRSGRAGARARARRRRRSCASGYGAALWAMEKYLRESNRAMSDRIRRAAAAGRARDRRTVAGSIDPVAGPVLLWSARRETRRHPAGRRLEPRTFVDRRNWQTA